MSTMVDPQAGSPPDGGPEVLTDDEVLARCRHIEERRRADLAEHVRLLRELERRKLYYGDGHRDLAGFGRAEHRWADRDAKAHRDLERLCRECPQILDQLTIGRVGAAQVFLLARLARAPRVGLYVAEQIDDFLDHAANLPYLAFEQYVLAWKCLMDADGPDPERAHRNRSASLRQTGLLGRFEAEGPAIDHARLKALMARFEEIEFQRDWTAAKERWGDDVSTDRLARTAAQRRYDAFQNLLDHVTLPKLPTFRDADLQDADLQDGDTEAATGGDAAADGDASVPTDETHRTAERHGCTGEDCCAGDPDEHRVEHTGRPTPSSPVETVVNLVIDGDTFLHGLELLLGISLTTPVRSPFGPDRAFCQTFDGDPIGVRDAVLAALVGKVRLVLRGPDGVPVGMTSSTRLFTGALRDAVLLTATHCTHPGCTVPASKCEIDHLRPVHQGGVTEACNGCVACGHHNRWRYLAGATVVRLADGTIATYRADGTRIAAPV